jgi:beta-lactamase class D
MRQSPFPTAPKSSSLALILAANFLLVGCTTSGTTVNPINASAGCEMLRGHPESTFVLYDVSRDRWSGCNLQRAETRFLPASTFKIPHALIALESGAVVDELSPMAWDGIERGIDRWNQDTSPSEAMLNSTVWVYQRIARAIGHETMSAWVRRLGYGNLDIGSADEIDHFWLDGNLRISAMEQVEFLNKLRLGNLPATSDTQARVRTMMVVERDHDRGWTLHAKSGAVLPIDDKTGDISQDSEIVGRTANVEHTGWYVGWVSRSTHDQADWVFAFNMEIIDPSDLAAREKLTRELLRRNGVETFGRKVS